MKLVTVAEMREIEQQADAHGLSYEMMMTNAGFGLAQVVSDYFSHESDKRILGLVGTGNNGGDTLVALAHLAGLGWQTRAYLLQSRPRGDKLLKAFTEAGGEIAQMDKDDHFTQLDQWLGDSDILLDGVLGTGIRLPLKNDAANLLGHVSQFPQMPHVVAVDCPSGVDCDSGATSPECIPAELTVCMAAIKTGLLNFPAFELVGDLQLVDIGLAEDLSAWKKIKRTVIDEDFVCGVLPVRKLNSHKGTFGTAAIAAGSINYTGAAYLAAKSAYRIGAGLVRLAIPGPLHTALAGQLPETTWILLPHEQGVISAAASSVLLKNLQKVTALLVGPGLGTEDTTAEFLKNLLLARSLHGKKSRIGFMPSSTEEESEIPPSLPPLVIDADGLKLLARIPDWHKALPALTVLTPHPGEMSALTGLSVEKLLENRIKTAEEFAQKWGHVVVLKTALTVIASPDGQCCVIPVATPALARAGTGDVLAGIITGLLAQGMSPYEAAAAGAWIHAQAGLIAETWLGSSASVMAGDVLESISDVLQELE